MMGIVLLNPVTMVRKLASFVTRTVLNNQEVRVSVGIILYKPMKGAMMVIVFWNSVPMVK